MTKPSCADGLADAAVPDEPTGDNCSVASPEQGQDTHMVDDMPGRLAESLAYVEGSEAVHSC